MEHLRTRQFHAGGTDHAAAVVASLEEMGWLDVEALGPIVTWPGSAESLKQVATVSYTVGEVKRGCQSPAELAADVAARGQVVFEDVTA